MPPETTPQKFGFDNDFFDVTVAPPTGGAGRPAGPPAITLGAGYVSPTVEKEKAAARDEGYTAGLTEGRAQAAQAAAAEVAELKNQLLAITNQLSATQTEWQTNLQKQCLSLMRLTLHHLIGHAASHYPDQLLEHYLKDLVPLIRTGEELHLRLHPQARTYHEKLGLPQASIGGRPFQIVPDSSLGPADVVVEWSQGGLEARLPDILQRVDTLLQSVGAQGNDTLPTPQAPHAGGFTPPAPDAPDAHAPVSLPPADSAPDDLAAIAQAQKARAAALLSEDEEPLHAKATE